MKETIAIFYGGQSVEHDISIITALQAMKFVPSKYNLLPIYMTQNGRWVSCKNLDKAEVYLDFRRRAKKQKEVMVKAGEPYLYIGKSKVKIDCALICCHGRGGEDGALAGMLRQCKIPFTSCDVMSAAVTMDKAMTKRVLKSYKIPSPDFVNIYSQDYKNDKFLVMKEIEKSLTFPLIVKPANLGSSVGITICEDLPSLDKAITLAFEFDEKVVVEQFLERAKEYACAAFKMGGSIICSNVQQIHKGNIYTFEEKYLSKKEEKFDKLPAKLENLIKKRTRECYSALDCDGVVRVDFLESEDGKLYVNEINSIPGSLAFNLFNLPFREIIQTLIDEAKIREEMRSKEVYEFSSKAIEAYIKISSQNKYTK